MTSQPSLFDDIYPGIDDERYFFSLLNYFNSFGYKGTKIIFNKVKPLSNFFSLTLKEIENIFISQYEYEIASKLRSILRETELTTASKKGEIFRQALSKYNGTLILTRESDDFKFLNSLRISVDWFFLYGNREIFKNRARLCSVVGTRTPTKAGIELTRNVVRTLVELGYVIVSGLADGIDTVAHKTAIENGGKTIAVLGTGVENVFPKQNQAMINTIMDSGGSIITEFPHNYKGNRESFVLRNRVISALSDIVFPVEGKEFSGTAHTVYFAREQGKRIIGLKSGAINSINNVVRQLQGIVIESTDLIKYIN